MEIKSHFTLFVLLVYCTLATAVVVNETLNTNEQYIFLHEFGFLEGGYAQINITTQVRFVLDKNPNCLEASRCAVVLFILYRKAEQRGTDINLKVF